MRLEGGGRNRVGHISARHLLRSTSESHIHAQPLRILDLLLSGSGKFLVFQHGRFNEPHRAINSRLSRNRLVQSRFWTRKSPAMPSWSRLREVHFCALTMLAGAQKGDTKRTFFDFRIRKFFRSQKRPVEPAHFKVFTTTCFYPTARSLFPRDKGADTKAVRATFHPTTPEQPICAHYALTKVNEARSL
jgi:hypothetical protein